jgi:hypothetical protein
VKKLLLTILCLGTFSSYTHSVENKQPSAKFEKALHHARKEIKRLHIKHGDLEHLAEYLEFYASWYAPVTPASLELRSSLSKKALDFIEKIKKIAKPLERKQDRRLLGASRLSEEGKLFYQKVIEALKKKLLR